MKKRGRPPKARPEVKPCPPPFGFCALLADDSCLTVEAKTVSWGTDWVQFWDCKGGEVHFIERADVKEIVEIELLAEVRAEGENDTPSDAGTVDPYAPVGELAGDLP